MSSLQQLQVFRHSVTFLALILIFTFLLVIVALERVACFIGTLNVFNIYCGTNLFGKKIEFIFWIYRFKGVFIKRLAYYQLSEQDFFFAAGSSKRYQGYKQYQSNKCGISIFFKNLFLSILFLSNQQINKYFKIVLTTIHFCIIK